MDEKFALVIGIERYQDVSIRPVRFAEADANGISEGLELNGFPRENIDVLLSSQATKATIESRLRKFCAEVDFDDYLIVFYAGHGFAENDHNFITCHDTQKGDLTMTSISLQDVLQGIKRSKCQRVILFLDSCHSGLEFEENMRGILSDMSEEEFLEFFKDSEFHVGFAACKSNQYSYHSDGLSHGIWSYHVIQALKGNDASALEKSRFLTANSLQAYLSKEVPRTLRKTVTGGAIQTPCMFGKLTKDFIIADLDPILEARRAKAQPQLTQLKRILFRRERGGKVKSLSGFSRWHHVPDAVNESTEKFVAKIGYGEIKEVAESLFEGIKDSFGYKRKDIDLGIKEGSASIICRNFDIDIFLSLNPEDPSEYLLRTEANNFRHPEIVRSKAFNQIFANTFTSLVFEFEEPINIEEVIDAIEELEDEHISVTYPGSHDICRISIKGLDAIIEVDPGEFRIINNRTIRPIDLVDTFFGVQRLLVSTHKIKQLPFGVNQLS